MAGRKHKRAVLEAIEKRGGSEFLIDYIGDGNTIKALAEEIGYSRSFTSRILNGHEEHRAALQEGRKILAEKMADDSLEILDTLAATPEVTNQQVQIAKEQVAHRKWMAALNDPSRFAPKQESITLNIGELHLGALKKISREMLDVTPQAVEIGHDGDED